MIGITLAATAVPVIEGLAWRRVRQLQVARAPKITSPNRIVEQRFVRVGGIDQWIQLRGEDRDNPVLLVLHGGPGWPNAVFTLPLRPWEQHFTVVQWDHRGAGKSLRRNGKAGNAKGVAALEKIGADPARWDLGAWNTNMAWAFRTNLPIPNLDRRLLFPLALSSPIYSLRDLHSLFVGFQWSTAQMFSELMVYDARRLGARLEIPFFLFQGETDVITLTTLAQEYFEEVEAPAKQLALIPDAGHFAAFTQPEQFLAELLARVHPVASQARPASMREP